MERTVLERVDMLVRGTDLIEYSGDHEYVVIPKYIRTVCKGAFSSSKIKKVEFSEGVRKVEPYAFYSCRQLEEVVCADSVTEIGEGAFAFCTALKSVELSDRLKSVGPLAFSGCTGLAELNLPASVLEVSKDSFSRETKVNTVENTRAQSLLAKSTEEKNIPKEPPQKKKEEKPVAGGKAETGIKPKKKRKGCLAAVIFLLLAVMVLLVFGLRAFDRPLFDTLLEKAGLVAESKADDLRSRLDEAMSLESMSEELKPEVTVQSLGVENRHPDGVSKIMGVSIEATDFLTSGKGNKYLPEFCADGDTSTSWQVNTEKNGVGEELTFTFEKAVPLSYIRYFGGNCKSDEKYKANHRPSKIVIGLVADGKKEDFPIELQDTMDCQLIEITGGPVVEKVIITIADVIQGDTYNETCVSEVEFYQPKE